MTTKSINQTIEEIDETIALWWFEVKRSNRKVCKNDPFNCFLVNRFDIMKLKKLIKSKIEGDKR